MSAPLSVFSCLARGQAGRLDPGQTGGAIDPESGGIALAQPPIRGHFPPTIPNGAEARDDPS
jgi:hypothetical protein